MSLRRVRRTPVSCLVGPIPSTRVRRTRPIVEEEETPIKARVTRTRRSAAEPVMSVATLPVRGIGGARPAFLIDWRRPLSWKFSIYMVTSYLYYHRSRSVITDSDFDRLCVELYEGYEAFEHQHKHLVDRGQIQAGTGYAIDHPLMVKNAAEHLLSHYAER